MLGVTEPFSCGIGGGGFMVAYDARKRRMTTIDHRETAPAAMRPDSFMENGVPLPFAAARYSGLSVGVPGTVDGWDEALRHHGTITLTEALAPAIRVAREGFVVDQTFVNQTQREPRLLQRRARDRRRCTSTRTARRATSARLPQPRPRADARADRPRAASRRSTAATSPRRSSTTVRQPAGERGREPRLAPGRHDRGATCAATSTIERAPTHLRYRDLDVFGMGPPSSGGSTVGEALNILEGQPLDSLAREDAMHRRLEASRLAFADRGAFLADPAFFDVPLRGLLSDGFAAIAPRAHRRHGADEPRRARRPVPVRRRRAPAAAAASPP